MPRQTAEEFAADFNTLAAAFGQDMTAALQECAPLILKGIEEHFDESRTAAGEAWPARKDPGPTHPLLILEGTLKLAATLGQINEVIDGQTLKVGVDKDVVPYAGVHQFGFPEGNIAQREYLAMSDVTIGACGDVIAKHAVSQVEG